MKNGKPVRRLATVNDLRSFGNRTPQPIFTAGDERKPKHQNFREPNWNQLEQEYLENSDRFDKRTKDWGGYYDWNTPTTEGRFQRLPSTQSSPVRVRRYTR